MTSPLTLSAASQRTSPPVITTLMQAALADPALISLAAGFVDQASLPTEATTQAVTEILADPS
jgi:2-aminoadipate transaminase